VAAVTAMLMRSLCHKSHTRHPRRLVPLQTPLSERRAAQLIECARFKTFCLRRALLLGVLANGKAAPCWLQGRPPNHQAPATDRPHTWTRCQVGHRQQQARQPEEWGCGGARRMPSAKQSVAVKAAAIAASTMPYWPIRTPAGQPQHFQCWPRLTRGPGDSDAVARRGLARSAPTRWKAGHDLLSTMARLSVQFAVTAPPNRPATRPAPVP